jgi:hypothetical protein
MRSAALLLLLLIALAAPAHAAGACDQWLRKTVRATGAYLPAEEAYSRPFVFALGLDCNGTRERVTVQRGTGNLPICERGQPVEVEGKLIWNKSLQAGHYEITNPHGVICLSSGKGHYRHFGHLPGASGQPPTPEYGSPHRPRRTCQVRTLSSTLG